MVMVCTVMAFIVVACIVMACIVMAYIAMTSCMSCYPSPCMSYSVMPHVLPASCMSISESCGVAIQNRPSEMMMMAQATARCYQTHIARAYIARACVVMAYIVM